MKRYTDHFQQVSVCTSKSTPSRPRVDLGDFSILLQGTTHHHTNHCQCGSIIQELISRIKDQHAISIGQYMCTTATVRPVLPTWPLHVHAVTSRSPQHPSADDAPLAQGRLQFGYMDQEHGGYRLLRQQLQAADLRYIFNLMLYLFNEDYKRLSH
jgi:hypothetical protein